MKSPVECGSYQVEASLLTALAWYARELSDERDSDEEEEGVGR